MSELRPEDYEALTGVTRDEYEQRLLAAAREIALASYPPGSDEATIDAVELDGGSRNRSLVILFRIPQRPGCVFGSRALIWPPPAPDDDEWGTPEGFGGWLAAIGIDEYVEQGGLVVHECVPGAVTWLP
jgi:hypothetical protein